MTACMVGGHLDEIAEHVVVLDLQRADAGLLGIGRAPGRRSPGATGRAAPASRRARRHSSRARSRHRASSSGSSSASARSSCVAKSRPAARQGAARAAASSGGSAALPSSRVDRRPRPRGRRASAPRSRGPPRRAPAATARAPCRAPPSRLARSASASRVRRRRRRPQSSRSRRSPSGSVERRHQPLGQQPRAGAGHRAVDRLAAASRRGFPTSSATSSRLARVAGSMKSVAPLSSRSGARQRRPFRLLRLLDIGDGARDRRQLGAREGAETVERGDPEEAGDALRRRRRIEQARRLRTGDAAKHVEQRLQRLVAEQRLGDDQLLRVDAEDVGRKPVRGRSRRRGTRRWRCRSRRARRRRRAPPLTRPSAIRIVRFRRGEQPLLGDACPASPGG